MASEKYITDKPVLYKSEHKKKTSLRNFYIISCQPHPKQYTKIT